jgi:serine/threonine-protein kinase
MIESFVEGSSAMIGTTLGRYEILEVLGRGGQSIAYKARDPKINRMVALKQILSNKGQPEKERADFLTRFLREAQSAGRLSHPNIATIYDFGGDEEGEPYIAMEYVDGCDLHVLIETEHPLRQARILRIFVQLCSALEYAHNAGIVHRDIKPGNIMLTREDRVKIVDFGIAKMDSASLTQAGTVMGTPHYMSPEQIMGKPVDRRSDIFSLGVVLYESLTGEKPFAGEHWTTVGFKIVNERQSSVLTREPSLLPDFDRIVEKVMAKDPAERFQSCAELGRVLEDLLRDHRLVSAPETSSPARPPPPVATEDVTGDSRSTPKPDPKEQTAVTAKPPAPQEVMSSVPSSGGSTSSEESLRAMLPALGTYGANLPVARDAEPPDEYSLTISKVGPSNMAEATALPPAAPRRPADGLAAVVAKRRSSVLLMAAALALIVALAFVVMAQIPRAVPPTLQVAQVSAVLMPVTEPSAVEQSLHDARAAIDQGHYVSPDGNDALHFVRVALAAEPANEDALRLEADIRTRALEEAEILRKRGRRAEVLAAYDLLLEHFSDDAEIQSKRDKVQSAISRAQLTAEADRSRKAGDKAFAAGDYNEAVRQFRNLARVDPKNAYAFYFLGRSNLALSALTEATRNLTRACKLEPANPTYNIRLGQVLEKNKDFANALVYIEKGIALGGDAENNPAALKAHTAELTFRMNLSRLTPQTLTTNHVHFFTRCAGKLVVTEAGISYIPDEKKEHAMQAPWEDVTRFEIAGGTLVVSTAEKTYTLESSALDRLTAIAQVFAARH